MQAIATMAIGQHTLCGDCGACPMVAENERLRDALRAADELLGLLGARRPGAEPPAMTWDQLMAAARDHQSRENRRVA